MATRENEIFAIGIGMRLVRERDLLRDTLKELKEALPQCHCGRVATHEAIFEGSDPSYDCDEHVSPHMLVARGGLAEETGWALVARRLGW